MSSFDFNIVVTGMTLVCFIAWRTWRNNSGIERQNAVASAARRFFDELLAVQKLTPLQSSVLLTPGETAFLESAADLCVKRSLIPLAHVFALKPMD